MQPIDILIIVLIVFNVLLWGLAFIALIQIMMLLNRVHKLLDSMQQTYSHVKNLDFLPSVVSRVILDRLLQGWKRRDND